jgi:hypothetical protein
VPIHRAKLASLTRALNRIKWGFLRLAMILDTSLKSQA